MGKVTTDVRLTNLFDLKEAQTNSSKSCRAVQLHDVIVATGATMLCLSKSLIEQLGLDFIRKIKVNTATGISETSIYGTVVFEIQGRSARLDVMELHHPKIQALVGQIPLEYLDFLINPSTNRLICNPEHEGQLILDLLIVSEDLKYELLVPSLNP